MWAFSTFSKDKKYTSLIAILQDIKDIDIFYLELWEYLQEVDVSEIDETALDQYWWIIEKHILILATQKQNQDMSDYEQAQQLVKKHLVIENNEHKTSDLLLQNL